ncbi:hypothetical protein [Bradyrhizobium sp. HKCCYLS3013]|uniref:hypothetical protein n=1 Tax=Bradyrhizobium sp. HKCCYLS3013 TaxID=3420735 RepID=UPI003EBDAAF9
MTDSNEILSLANWLASQSLDQWTESTLTNLMVSQAEQMPNTMRRLQTPEVAEALMTAFEAADAMKRLQNALLPVAEAGSVSALVDAISLGSKDAPDIGVLSKTLVTVMEGSTNPK